MSRREKIEALLAETPDDVFLNYSLAMECTKVGEVEDARKAFATCRELDPNYVPAYFQEGQLLAGQDQIAEAQAILNEGIAVARAVGDDHALGEMTEFLAQISP